MVNADFRKACCRLTSGVRSLAGVCSLAGPPHVRTHVQNIARAFVRGLYSGLRDALL